jgi:hypothetical protein
VRFGWCLSHVYPGGVGCRGGRPWGKEPCSSYHIKALCWSAYHYWIKCLR